MPVHDDVISILGRISLSSHLILLWFFLWFSVFWCSLNQFLLFLNVHLLLLHFLVFLLQDLVQPESPFLIVIFFCIFLFFFCRTWCSLKHKEADLKKFSKEAAKDEEDEEEEMKGNMRMEVRRRKRGKERRRKSGKKQGQQNKVASSQLIQILP